MPETYLTLSQDQLDLMLELLGHHIAERMESLQKLEHHNELYDTVWNRDEIRRAKRHMDFLSITQQDLLDAKKRMSGKPKSEG